MADTTEILQSIIAAKSAEADRQQKAVELGLNSFFKAAELRNKGNDLDTLLKYGKIAEVGLQTGNKQLYDLGKMGTTGFMASNVVPNQLQSLLTQPTTQQSSQTQDLVPDKFNKFGEPESYTSLQTEKAKNLSSEQSKAREGFDAYASDASGALVALDKLEAQATNLGDFKRGGIGQAIAKGKTAYGSFAKDENITKYIGVVNQELIPLARKLAEEKGPITDSDVSRIQKGLGDLTTPLEDKKFLFNELRNKVKEAIKTKSDIAGISEDVLKTKYKNVYEKLFRKFPMPPVETAPSWATGWDEDNGKWVK